MLNKIKYGSLIGIFMTGCDCDAELDFVPLEDGGGNHITFLHQLVVSLYENET